jgi:hypothetical protein
MELPNINDNPMSWIGNLIKFNYMYSNEKSKVGIIASVEKDPNFTYMLKIISDNNDICIMPWSLMMYELVQKSE